MYLKTTLTFENFQAMEHIERQYYDSEYIAPADTSYAWYLHWPHSVLAAFEDDTIIGFMNLFPIKEDLFNRILQGTYNDSALTPQDICIPSPTSTSNENSAAYPLFLSCVAVDMHYRKKGVARFLLKAYLELYANYEQQGYQFNRLITDNVTAAGLQFSQAIGLETVMRSDHDSWICTGTYESLKRSLTND